MEAIEAAALAKLGQIKHELMLIAQTPAQGEHEQVSAHYCERLRALSAAHKRRKAGRDRKRADYLTRLTGEALEQALESLKRESRVDSAERRALKQERNYAIAPLAKSVAEVEVRVRSLKRQYTLLSAQLQQQLQAAYFADLASGKIEIEPLAVLYEDADLLMVDKPAGLLSVPGRRWNLQDSVVSRLRYQLRACSFLQAVHRLDRDTSGVMAIALSASVHAALSEQFAKRQVHKVYEAVLFRRIERAHGLIDLPVWSCLESRPKQVVDRQKGKPSQTEFEVLAQSNRTRVKLIPLTGRTHQLRVHAAHPDGLNSPILGDSLYGASGREERLFLHAKRLEFTHPVGQQLIQIESAVPF